MLVDHNRTPSAADVAVWLDRARQRGFAGVRTSALFPAAADVLATVGFSTADRLALLRLDGLAEREVRSPEIAVGPLRPWQRRAAADIDQAAFGHEWGNDTAGLGGIVKATPSHLARRIGRPIAGFALSGAAGTTGYLQRLAVHPDARRRGYARALVDDALLWMQRRGLTSVLVNTGIDNEPALRLYAAVGFTPVNQQLTVAEYRFDD